MTASVAQHDPTRTQSAHEEAQTAELTPGLTQKQCNVDASPRGPIHMDPNPDYDASDELEYFFSWLPWALRGVYPPPAYPPI